MLQLSDFSVSKFARRQLICMYKREGIIEDEDKITLLKKKMGIHFSKSMTIKELERLFAYKYLKGE